MIYAPVLTLVMEDVFPDHRSRYLCPKCVADLRKHQKRLVRARTG